MGMSSSVTSETTLKIYRLLCILGQMASWQMWSHIVRKAHASTCTTIVYGFRITKTDEHSHNRISTAETATQEHIALVQRRSEPWRWEESLECDSLTTFLHLKKDMPSLSESE